MQRGFIDIPDDIFLNGVQDALGVEILMLSSTCKRLRELFLEEIELLLSRLVELSMICPPVILDLLGGMRNLAIRPRLEWNECFRGDTNYMDGIHSNDLCAPIQWGRSSCKRSFITLRTNLGAVCLFQRYSDSVDTWTVGDGDRTGLFCHSGHSVVLGVIKDDFLAFNVFNLIVGNTTQFSNSWVDGCIESSDPVFLV